MTSLITFLLLQFGILTGNADDATKSTTPTRPIPQQTTQGGTGNWQ